MSRVYFVSEAAQVELKSERVYAPGHGAAAVNLTAVNLTAAVVPGR